MKKITFLLIFTLLIGLISFNTVALAEDGEFVISNLEENDITIEVEKLKELPVVTKDVTSVDSGGNEDNYTVKGALFSDLLDSLGYTKSDLKAVNLVAGDGYSIELPENVLVNRQIILAYEIDGEPLGEKVKPVRVIIPEERAMYWIKNLTTINVVDMVKSVEIESLVLMETAFGQLEKVDYTYYESTDQAVGISNLIEKFELTTNSRTVSFTAADGFEKDEQVDIFKDGYIKITGDNAPLFISPDIPKGMHVKDLLFVNYGFTSVCSLTEALNVYEKSSVEDMTGISLKKLVEEAGLKSADKYMLTASDGYSVEVSSSDLENGILYLEDGDVVRTTFSNLSKKFWVKNLLKIESIM